MKGLYILEINTLCLIQVNGGAKLWTGSGFTCMCVCLVAIIHFSKKIFLFIKNGTNSSFIALKCKIELEYSIPQSN